MTLRLKPLCVHAASLVVALTLATGISLPQFGASPALALDTDEPAPASKPAPSTGNSGKPAPAPSAANSGKSEKKTKVKKKKKKFKDENDTSWLDDKVQPPARPDLTLASAQIKAGHYRAAIITLNRLRRPDDANVLNLLGYSHRKLGLVDVGMRYYLAALERNPEHKGVHEYLGEAYLQKNDLAKAQVMLLKLGRICGTQCEPYRELSAAIADYKAKHSL